MPQIVQFEGQQHSFPDDFSQSDIASALGSAPAKPSGVGAVAADVAKSAGIGAVEGGIGLVGLPGDAGSLISSGVSKLGSLAGIDPATVQSGKDAFKSAAKYIPGVSAFSHGMGSQDIQKAIESGTGEFYKPQTMAGEYARTAGEFLPALLGGPESLLMKLVTRVAAPAVASETAGQLTKGTAAEPYARVAGALAGGGLASIKSKPQSLTPSAEQLFDKATELYQHPTVAALQIKPQAAVTLADDIAATLLQQKLDPLNAPKVLGIIERLKTPRFGQNTTVSDLDLARQSLSSVPIDEMRAAAAARKAIDSYMHSIPQADVIAGNAKAANKIMLEARANYAAASRSEEITKAMGRAENQAGATYSGGNLENATRQQLKTILNEKQGVSKRRGFQDYTAEEIAALKPAVNGTAYGNIVRGLGKTLGGGGGLGNVVSGVATGGTAHQAGVDPVTSTVLGLGAMLGGRALNRYGNKLAVDRAKNVDELLRSRSPLAQQSAAWSPANQMVPSQTSPGVMLNNPNYVAPGLDPKIVAMLNAYFAANPQIAGGANR